MSSNDHVSLRESRVTMIIHTDDEHAQSQEIHALQNASDCNCLDVFVIPCQINYVCLKP